MMKIRIDDQLLLKPLSPASAEVIFSSIQRSRDHLAEWLPFVDNTRTVGDVRTFIRSVVRSDCQKKDQVYEIWYKNHFAGLFGLKEIDQVNKKLEMGYWLDQEMTGKGIMLKSCSAMITHVFRKMNMNRVCIKVAVDNEKSCKIPGALGFQYEGMERGGEYIRNRYHDLKVYSLLKNEWNP